MSLIGLEHDIIVFHVWVLLISNYSIIYFWSKRYIPRACFLSNKMHGSEALIVWLKLFNLLKSWSYDILDTKCTLVKHHNHGIDRWTMSLCNFEDLFKFLMAEWYVTSIDFPIKNVRRCKIYLGLILSGQLYLRRTFGRIFFKAYIKPETVVKVKA